MGEPIDTVLARAARITADGRPRVAIELLRPVVDTNPDHAGAWCRLSVAYLDAGDLTESLDAAKRAITLGERSWAHRLASLALGELGRFEESVSCAREAVRRDPADWRCHVALAEALAPTEPDEALAVAKVAIDLAPREARPHEVLGDIAAAADDAPLARRSYRDALALDPGNVHITASLNALNSRPAPEEPPPPPQRPVFPPARFGRAQRIALWLVVRRVSVWLAVGSLLLIVAGLSDPGPMLAWFGFGLLVFAVGMVVRGWLRLPPGGRVGPAGLKQAEPLLLAAALPLGLALLFLLIWTLSATMGASGLQLLAVVLVCSALSAGLSWLNLWRLRLRSR
ncbi:MAG TPA: tetratricopeptide repeat protein [Actinophytocola sp.]|uniref:tetratricopeptide repeat protein n=1 Tax=Actinophytocola sp. TaxID=1872138 RepID=UPI002DBEF3AF|nr:tetratricopeptide repeat protein [Actinophytocola sp.]HEU5472504.1 tetratricopeptide repeat protein [Actinophytocola sp.]